jgi:hypothetical protein
MALRISLGPAFIYESLILARRRQVYTGRAIFCLRRVDRPDDGLVWGGLWVIASSGDRRV